MTEISITKFGILKLSTWLVYLSLYLSGRGVGGGYILEVEQQRQCYKELAPVQGC